MGRERWLAGLHRERERKREKKKEWARRRELAQKAFCNFKIFSLNSRFNLNTKLIRILTNSKRI
jgi:hypothetical protein